MKHTPGPWRVGTLLEGPTLYITGADDATVASLRLHTADGKDKTRQANARLIAAAPELLDVLINLADEVEAMHRDYPPVMLEYARAAIAKATGERDAK